jgi:putative flippase GtrA
MNKRNRRLAVQFVEYMISGGAYFWTGYAIFFLCYDHRFLGLSLWWSKLAANIIGWTVNYLLQRYWVFKNPKLKGHFAETSGKYLFITAVDFVLDYLIVAGLKSVGITPYIGQFISSGFFTFWNYVWYRFWVFPEKYKPTKRAPRPSLRHSHRVVVAARR